MEILQEKITDKRKKTSKIEEIIRTLRQKNQKTLILNRDNILSKIGKIIVTPEMIQEKLGDRFTKYEFYKQKQAYLNTISDEWWKKLETKNKDYNDILSSLPIHAKERSYISDVFKFLYQDLLQNKPIIGPIYEFNNKNIGNIEIKSYIFHSNDQIKYYLICLDTKERILGFRRNVITNNASKGVVETIMRGNGIGSNIEKAHYKFLQTMANYTNNNISLIYENQNKELLERDLKERTISEIDEKQRIDEQNRWNSIYSEQKTFSPSSSSKSFTTNSEKNNSIKDLIMILYEAKGIEKLRDNFRPQKKIRKKHKSYLLPQKEPPNDLLESIPN